MNVSFFPNEQPLCAAKILIVDDEAAHIQLLEWALRVAKFSNVRSLTDPAQAMKVFKQFQPDLVLLDLYMPKPDGFAILKQLRAAEGAQEFLPVLALTGYDTAETRNQALAAGASDFLGKPIDCTQMMLRIKNLLQTRFLHRRAREMQIQLEAFRAAGDTKVKVGTGRKRQVNGVSPS